MNKPQVLGACCIMRHFFLAAFFFPRYAVTFSTCTWQ